jgi:subtilisin family serine protease
MSIVGPPNQTLERVVGAMVRRGHLLVAAVGNDGPAAPPLYPASYPGVVGVSAVDKRGRVLLEAGRGPQVMFAAPGNNMVSAAPGEPAFRQVRGTSFAAPIVTAMLAEHLAQPGTPGAAQALALLAKKAVRLDAASVSNETGLGIVGQDYRIDPSRLR